MFKGSIFGIFEHRKTFFGNIFYYFFCHIHEKCFCNHFLIFHKTKCTCCQQQFFKIHFKILKYWFLKKYLFDVSPKNSFLEPNLIERPTKKQNFHKKKCFEWFIPIKIECIGF